jgi:copper homeostasis protein
VTSLHEALTAEAGGADRLELCSTLEVGGLTPPLPLVDQVLSRLTIPVVAMVRPRAGGFIYSPVEKKQMLCEAESLLERGVEGIVCGALNSQDGVDTEFWKELVSRCGGRELVFHRAIDEAQDVFRTLDELAALGTTRVLTSGRQPTAIEGASLIRQMQEHAAGRIEILPGAGVNSANVLELIRDTGCDQVHGSFRKRSSRDPAQPHPGTSLEEVTAVKTLLTRRDHR